MKPNYILHAEALLGQHEGAGKLDNPTIVELYKDAGHPEVINDSVPWCAAFVGACLARGNIRGTRTLLARDYMDASKWAGEKLSKPEAWCVGVMRRGNSGWEGHVGFVVQFDKNYVWMLGGNQADEVNVSKYPRSKFVAFMRPVQTMDKEEKAVIKDSRRLSTQTWFERVAVSLGLGGAVSWNTLNEFKSFVNDHTGVIIIGLITVAWGASRLVKWMSLREYKQGRYQPSKQWL